MQIFIKSITGKTLTFDVESSDTTDTVAAMVEAKEDIPVKSQRLVFAGRNLEPGRTLAAQNVNKESTIYVVLRLGSGTPIFINMPNGKVVQLYTNIADTVGDLKYRIEEDQEYLAEVQELPAEDQGFFAHEHRVVYLGQELEDDRRLLDYGMSGNETIRLLHRSAAGTPQNAGTNMKVFVRMVPGRLFTVEVDCWANGAQLKVKVEASEDIATEMQRLIYRGQELRDDDRLAQYGIRVEGIRPIYLVRRLTAVEIAQ